MKEYESIGIEFQTKSQVHAMCLPQLEFSCDRTAPKIRFVLIDKARPFWTYIICQMASESVTQLRPSVDCNTWCSTYFTEDIKHTFIWNIHRFSEVFEDNDDEKVSISYISFCPPTITTKLAMLQPKKSSQFRVCGENHSSLWRLYVYNSKILSEDEYLSVFLENKLDTEVFVKKYTLAIVDRHGHG